MNWNIIIFPIFFLEICSAALGSQSLPEYALKHCGGGVGDGGRCLDPHIFKYIWILKNFSFMWKLVTVDLEMKAS